MIILKYTQLHNKSFRIKLNQPGHLNPPLLILRVSCYVVTPEEHDVTIQIHFMCGGHLDLKKSWIVSHIALQLFQLPLSAIL